MNARAYHFNSNQNQSTLNNTVIYNQYNQSAFNKKSPIKFTVIPQHCNKFQSVSCPKTISAYNTSSSSICTAYFIPPNNQSKLNFSKSSAYFENDRYLQGNNTPLFRSHCNELQMHNSQISSATPSNIIINYCNNSKILQNHPLSSSKIRYNAKIDDFLPKQNQNIYRNKLKQSYLSESSFKSDKSLSKGKKLKVTLAGDIYYDKIQYKPKAIQAEQIPKQILFSPKNSLIIQKTPIISQQNYIPPKNTGVYFQNVQQITKPLSNNLYCKSFQKPSVLTIRRPLSHLPVLSSFKSRQKPSLRPKSPQNVVKFNYISSPSKSDGKINLLSFHFKNPAKSKLRRKQSKQSSACSNNSKLQSQRNATHVIKSQQISNEYFPQFKVKKKKILEKPKEVDTLSTNSNIQKDRRNTFIDKLQNLQKEKQSQKQKLRQNNVFQDYGLPSGTANYQSKYATCSKYTCNITQPLSQPYIRTIKISTFGQQANKQSKKIDQYSKINKISKVSEVSEASKLSDYEMNSEDEQSEEISLSSRQQRNSSIFSKDESSNETYDQQLAKKIKKQLSLNFSYKAK